MADTPKLVATDNLVTAFPKINASIDNANLAKQIQDGVQAQIDALVIDGDSSPEAAQARVEADGTTNATLQARLNKKEAEFTTQLAQSAKQIKDNVVNVTSFGAIGDYYLPNGTINPIPTDNTVFIQNAFNESNAIKLAEGTYYCANSILLPNDPVIHGNHCKLAFENDGLNLGAFSWNTPKLYQLEVFSVNIATPRTGRGIFTDNGYIVYPVFKDVYVHGFLYGIYSKCLSTAANFTWGNLDEVRVEYCTHPVYFNDGWMNALEIGTLTLNFNDVDAIVFDTCNQLHSITIDKLILESNSKDETTHGSPVLFKNCSNGEIIINSMYIEDNGYSATASAGEIVTYKAGVKVPGLFYDSKTWELNGKWYSEDTGKITNKDLYGSAIFRFENCLANLKVTLKNVFITTNLLGLAAFTNSPLTVNVEKLHLINLGYSFPNVRSFFTNTTPLIDVKINTKELTNDGGGATINYGEVLITGDLFSNPKSDQYGVFKTSANLPLPVSATTAVPWDFKSGGITLSKDPADNKLLVVKEKGLYLFSLTFVFQEANVEGLTVSVFNTATNQTNLVVKNVSSGLPYSSTGLLYLNKGDIVKVNIKNLSPTTVSNLTGYLNNANYLNVQKIN